MTYILVAEDDPHIQLLIRSKLEVAGYKVRTTGNGNDALNMAQSEPPRILLLDVMLPGMSGLEICASVKKMPKAPPIMIISAKGGEEDVAAAELAGADDYLIKPFLPRELLERVRKLLGQV